MSALDMSLRATPEADPTLPEGRAASTSRPGSTVPARSARVCDGTAPNAQQRAAVYVGTVEAIPPAVWRLHVEDGFVTRRRISALSASLLAGLALGLGACGGYEDDDDGGSDSPGTTTLQGSLPQDTLDQTTTGDGDG